jgi:hypothetical protein
MSEFDIDAMIEGVRGQQSAFRPRLWALDPDSDS